MEDVMAVGVLAVASLRVVAMGVVWLVLYWTPCAGEFLMGRGWQGI